MKTTISGLIAAVMALSVFATAGFAFYMPSASVASVLDADGFTTYSTASVLMQGPVEKAYTYETWNSIGSIYSVQNVEATSGFWMWPAGMQTSEYTQVSGVSTVAQATVWDFADANIYNGLFTPTLINEQRVDNFGSGAYAYSADVMGTGTFASSIGINKPTDCSVVGPKPPVWPTCIGAHCPLQ